MKIVKSNGIPMPRNFTPRIRQRLTLGYMVANPASGSISVSSDDFQNLFAIPTFNSTTVSAALYKQAVASYRLHRVSVWGSGAAGVFNTISIKWGPDSDSIGSITATSVSSTSYGVETPAYLSVVPPPSTSQAMWWDADSPDEKVFTVFCQDGGVGTQDLFIEVDVELVFTVGIVTQAIAVTGFATSAAAIAVGNITAFPLNSTTGTTVATCAMPRGIPSTVTLTPNT